MTYELDDILFLELMAEAMFNLVVEETEDTILKIPAATGGKKNKTDNSKKPKNKQNGKAINAH